MSNILDLIKAEAEKRLGKDSVMGAYLISFSIYNWKAVIFLLDISQTSQDKIDAIESIINRFYYSGLWAPLLFAGFYLYVYTYASSWLEEKHQSLVLSKDFAVLNTEHDGKKFEKEIANLKMDYEQKIKELTDKHNRDKKENFRIENEKALELEKKLRDLENYGNAQQRYASNANRLLGETLKEFFHFVKLFGLEVDQFNKQDYAKVIENSYKVVIPGDTVGDYKDISQSSINNIGIAIKKDLSED